MKAKPAAPKLVGFDIDDTLVDFRAMLRAALDTVGRELERTLGTRLSADDLQALREASAAVPAIAAAGLEAVRRESFRQAITRLGGNPDEHVDSIWQSFLEARRPQDHLYPEVTDALRRLHAGGIRLIAASNGNTPLRETDISAYFEIVLFAGEIGFRKPELGFFWELARRSGTDPEEILYVGDSLLVDYLPAMKSGMSARLLCRHEALRPAGVETIASLGDLPSLWNEA